MTLHEPATFVTDCLLAVFAVWLAWRLRRSSPNENRAVRWLSHALALTAASALVGGAYHAFAPNFPPAISASWWRLTLLTINLLSAAMAVSCVHEVAPPALHHRLSIVVVTKLLLFASAAMVHPVFWVAIADYGSTLLTWLAAAALLRRLWRTWMLSAIALSAIAAAVQQFRWAPAPWFNHNDLYHLIQISALVAFYKAGLVFTSPSKKSDVAVLHSMQKR